MRGRRREVLSVCRDTASLGSAMGPVIVILAAQLDIFFSMQHEPDAYTVAPWHRGVTVTGGATANRNVNQGRRLGGSPRRAASTDATWCRRLVKLDCDARTKSTRHRAKGMTGWYVWVVNGDGGCCIDRKCVDGGIRIDGVAQE